MIKDVIDFKHGKVMISINDNLIYLRIIGEWQDSDAILVTKYLENFFAQQSVPTIRIWDASELDAKHFKITSQATRILSQWAERIKVLWPGNEAYFVGKDPLFFGITRMYELRTSDDQMPMSVVSTLDELPEEIKSRLSFADKTS